MERDSMAEINRYCQKNKFILKYVDVGMTGPSHCPEFTVQVKINEEVYGEGTGKSKKEARAVAARRTWEMVKPKDKGAEGQLPQRESSEVSSSTATSSNSHDVSNLSDSDSGGICFKDSDASLEEKVENMAIAEQPPPSQKNARCSGQKSPGKVCFLAPTFDRAVNRQVTTSDLEESLSGLHINGNDWDKDTYPVDGRFLKDFQNIEAIGEGGFGNVFKATARTDGKTYAVKRVKMTRNVLREVQELARLNHENIVRYYCSWTGEDYVKNPDSRQKAPLKCECLFIQMELCEQGTLENWVENNRENNNYQEMAQDKFLQIVRGVEYIHSKGLIHRDLKPQNIFISSEDKIKIGDFGLVTSESYTPLTENRGTKSYMAPEQFGDTYGKEVDIYALGLIWFEIVSALASHHEKSIIWKDVREGNFPMGFTEKFLQKAGMMKKMLSKNPQKRPSAARILTVLNTMFKDNLHKAHTH